MPSPRTQSPAPLGGSYSPPAPSVTSATTSTTPQFAGRSPAHLAAIDTVERFAPYEHATVLIEGETGTGKSYVARHLHLRSPRARGTYHQVVLSTLDDNLAASDLFGHLSGSYTDARQNRPGHFVTANGGTLLLDEIGKASPSVQRKLLHAIEHREIWPVGADRAVRLNVRLVAATNIPLATLVERGTFLDDLAARLTTFRVRLPSLAERRDDIPPLVRQFAALRAPLFNYPVRAPEIDGELMEALRSAEWPCNLRQLDGVVQRLLMEGCGDPTLTLAHCVGELQSLVPRRAEPDRALTPRQVGQRMSELRSVAATARSLGVSRWTVYRYLERDAGATEGAQDGA